MSLEISNIGKADGLGLLEGNIQIHAKMASDKNFPGVKEPGMLTNDYTATWEILQLFFDAIYTEELTKEYDKQPIKRKNVKRFVGSRIAL